MIYLISDTHFNHANMIEFCGRPADFEKKIIKNLKNLHHDDILIHLGDICMGRDVEAHKLLNEHCMAKRWLIKGNHDRQSYHWYMCRGWAVVAESMVLSLHNEKILLSHKPSPLYGNTLNIHGHFHNNPITNCEPELTSVLTDRHLLFTLEHHYAPILLEKFIANSLTNLKK